MKKMYLSSDENEFHALYVVTSLPTLCNLYSFWLWEALSLVEVMTYKSETQKHKNCVYNNSAEEYNRTDRNNTQVWK